MDVKELIGVTLGTCTLERILGRGGMGAVYLAQQARPVRTVAVKVLIPSNNLEPDQQSVFLERFRREADTVAKLEHKNILPIYEYDEAVYDGQQIAYLVMPYIRGGTLRERIDDMRRNGTYFDLALVASYIGQVADALSYAHSLGVVHRDVKPGNLLFHQDGRLLLSDFGIVRLQAMPSLTNVGSFLGTAEYASPEQISTTNIDFRSDIYSLGIILYELLTNNVPYTGATPFAVMASKLSEAVPPITSVRPDLSASIEAVVMKALARNPGDRYQTATLLAADLRAAVASASSAHLRLSGDANNSDLTIAERPWGALSPLEATVPASGAGTSFPPTQPAPYLSPGVGNGTPWQQPPGAWQWPSQAQTPAQRPVGVLPASVAANTSGDATYDKADVHQPVDAPTYREGRRLFYYGTALLTLLLQFLVFIFLFSQSKDGTQLVAALGVLIGSAINLLVLAAIGFTAVTRSRPTRRFLYRGLIATLIAPLLSGIFINFGAGLKGLHAPLIAYIILLISNLYLLRQLVKVDAAKEQIEVAPISWRSALVASLTGLLPLSIILIFALEAPFTHVSKLSPLLNLLGMLLVVFIGTPTPGAVMAIRLMKNTRFPILFRSSAIAGMVMAIGASLIVIIWGLLFPNRTQFLYDLSHTWVAMLIIVGVLCIISALRGMLDTWMYQRIRNKN